MSGNTFGRVFRLTTYGESHGPGLGGVIDGCPAGLPLSEADIQSELDLRKPGQGPASTPRKESDRVRLLSGVFEGLTTGAPIGFHVANEDQRSGDYSKVKDLYRPGHADMSWQAKYGIRDYRGGGRSSGRETACRVVGGAVAKVLLARVGIRARAFTVELGGIAARILEPDAAQGAAFFSPDPEVIPLWDDRVRQVKAQGDSLGGVVQVEILGVPAGLGEPVFDKLDARLAYALMGVGAVKAVEVGEGLAAARSLGSANNDPMLPGQAKGAIDFASNHAGGILGGVSSGQTIVLRAAVKPIPSISLPQRTVTTAGEAVELRMGGRHDIAAIPRIVPVLKAMALLVIADAWLLQAARPAATPAP